MILLGHRVRKVIDLLACYINILFSLFKDAFGKRSMSHDNKHLMTGSEGNSEFCFPRISMFPSTSSRETLRFSGNKIHCSPRNQSLRDLLYSKTKLKSKIWKPRWDSSHHLQQQSTVNCWPGNSELFPVWRHSFRNVARSWHLAGNSFIVRCHVTMN